MDNVPLSDFEGEWVQVREEVHYTHDGYYSIKITRISDGKVLIDFKDDHIDMWRIGSSYIRSKFGLYRSLAGGRLNQVPVGQSPLLKNESLWITDFRVYEKNPNPARACLMSDDPAFFIERPATASPECRARWQSRAACPGSPARSRAPCGAAASAPATTLPAAHRRRSPMPALFQRHIALDPRHLQQFDNSPLQLGIEVAAAAEVLVGFVDARLERLVDASGALCVDRRDRLRVSVLASIARRMDRDRALRDVQRETCADRPDRFQLRNRILPVGNPARHHDEVDDQSIGGQPRGDDRM